jgi:sRNA-binding carbon storage regulator CsrA
MLVLSRETLESIVVTVPPSDRQRTIKVTVLEVRSGGRARIGFEAGLEVVIDREEVWRDKVADGTIKPDGATDDGQPNQAG